MTLEIKKKKNKKNQKKTSNSSVFIVAELQTLETSREKSIFENQIHLVDQLRPALHS